MLPKNSVVSIKSTGWNPVSTRLLKVQDNNSNINNTEEKLVTQERVPKPELKKIKRLFY